MKNCVESIEETSTQIGKANEAVNVTKIAEAALWASQTGTPIYLDLKWIRQWWKYWQAP